MAEKPTVLMIGPARPVIAKGLAPVFELVGTKGEVREDARWADALAAYRARDFARAAELWGDLAIGGDRAAAVMRARADQLRAEPPPDDWDGVYEQRSK